MVRDLPHVESDNLSRQQILQHAAQELHSWQHERQQVTRQRWSPMNLVLCGVALLIFLCGYVAGQSSNGASTSSPSSATHETIKP